MICNIKDVKNMFPLALDIETIKWTIPTIVFGTRCRPHADDLKNPKEIDIYSGLPVIEIANDIWVSRLMFVADKHGYDVIMKDDILYATKNDLLEI